MPAPAKIDSFSGEWEFLSNFYTYPIVYRDILFKSSEHAYQADKFLDEAKRRVFSYDQNPRLTAFQAKKLGRTMKSLRPDWEEAKLASMRDVLIVKFTPMGMRLKLASTGHAELVEGNWWEDRWWGVCYGGLPNGFNGRKCKAWPHDPAGENHLGILLMKVRTLLMPDEPDWSTV